MKKSILAVWLAMSGTVLMAQDTDAKIRESWMRIREELRRAGYPVAALVETKEEVAADMERVRREMERRAGNRPVSNMQRIGGGGGPVAPKHSGPVKVKSSTSLRK
jgi:hypothetical protein